ncbi:MAG: SGNH/GDSL hydrolase family protein [Planctomycetota bacterium]
MWQTGEYGYPLDYLLWWVVLASLLVHTWYFFRSPARHRRKRRYLILGNSLIGLCFFAGIGVALESYLRFVSTATDCTGATLTCKRWKVAYAVTNSLGHRDREWTPSKPKGVRRIAFVGDSFTYGWGVDDPEQRFTNLLQKHFDAQTHGQVEVMNVAWGGWGTRDHLRAARRIIDEYAVDEVVLCYLPNDMEYLLPDRDGKNFRMPPRSTFLRTSGSFLLDYLYYRVYVPWSVGAGEYSDWLASGFADPTFWGQHRSDLVSIAELCRGNHVMFRVVLLPFLRVSGLGFRPEHIHQQVAAVFQEIEVPVLDLLPTLRGQDVGALVVNAHDPHPNERAHALFAEAIKAGFYPPQKMP